MHARTGKIDPHILEVASSRTSLARRNFKKWASSVGLEYFSPHKFRHGHIHWGRENVMHSNIAITDDIYNNLEANKLGEIVNNLSREKISSADSRDLIRALNEALAILEKGTDDFS
jgi:integrase